MGIKSKQVDKLLLARMLFTAMVVPATGSAADHILVDPTADATALAAVTGNAYNGTDLPLVVATSSTEGWIEGDIVQLLDSTNSAPLTFDGEELYARLSTDAANMKFSFFTNIDGVETPASIEEESIGAATMDILFSYRYKFANLPEDALIRTKRSYVGDDNDASGDNLVPYREVVTIDTLNTLPQPSVAVGAVVVGTTNTYDVKVFVNGIYEPLVAYDQPTNALTWDANTIGYSLTSSDEVVYQYHATMASLALVSTGPIGTDILATWDRISTGFGAITFVHHSGNSEDISAGARWESVASPSTSNTYTNRVASNPLTIGNVYRVYINVTEITGDGGNVLTLDNNGTVIPFPLTTGLNYLEFTAADTKFTLEVTRTAAFTLDCDSVSVYAQ